jgi:hypothetical protein
MKWRVSSGMSSRRSARRARDRHHVQPVVKFLPEAALRGFRRQVAGGGGDHPQVDPHLVGAAGAGELLFGQHAQDLGLGAKGMSPTSSK